MTSDKDVLKIALSFKEEMRRIGKDFKFTKAKDITKTYQFRWFRSFLNKCKSDGFTVEESFEVMRCLVAYANKNSLTHIGASLVGRKDVIEIAYKRFERESKTCDDMADDLKRCMNSVGDNFFGHLIKRPNRKGYSNIVMMFMDGQISKTFLSLSRSCISAYNNIGNDKKELPTMIELVKTRLSAIDKLGCESIKEIMGNEFNG